MDKYKMFKDYVYKYQLGSTLDNVSFKCLTSLKIGGICKVMYIPDDIEGLTFCIKYLKDLDLPYFIIGAGTNLLVNDKNFDLVVISLKKLKRYYIEKEDDEYVYIYSESGVRAPILSDYIANKEIPGAEFLSVIPGSMGGLIYMNAGAYKKSISDIIDSITFIDEVGNVQTQKNKDNNFNFAYRDSIFKHYNYIIISMIIKLKKVNDITEKPKDKIKRFLKIKKETQPIECANAGSTFKNKNNLFSWQIIDKLGYRGFKVGGAEVSSKHANFIVNAGNATFDDMMSLVKMIKFDANNKLNIEMECEWEILE